MSQIYFKFLKVKIKIYIGNVNSREISVCKMSVLIRG